MMVMPKTNIDYHKPRNIIQQWWTADRAPRQQDTRINIIFITKSTHLQVILSSTRFYVPFIYSFNENFVNLRDKYIKTG